MAAALTLAAGLLITGGRGLGGVARAADGLAGRGGGGDRARAFAIMRDPHRGTAGVVAAGAALALRLAFLAALPPSIALPALVLAGAMGGWAVAFSLSAFPVAGGGEGETDPRRPRPARPSSWAPPPSPSSAGPCCPRAAC